MTIRFSSNCNDQRCRSYNYWFVVEKRTYFVLIIYDVTIRFSSDCNDQWCRSYNYWFVVEKPPYFFLNYIWCDNRILSDQWRWSDNHMVFVGHFCVIWVDILEIFQMGNWPLWSKLDLTWVLFLLPIFMCLESRFHCTKSIILVEESLVGTIWNSLESFCNSRIS